jgi:aryl-alcohol dehydrogenase-like predicted oxidoreductase
MSLNAYTTLGRSGLKISPLCLGTMTFGNPEWGTDENTSRAIFNRYLEPGGNFLDTADGYAGGRSEELLGKFVAERKLRDRVVMATKFTFNADPGNPNAGGNGRKNLYRALEGSLRRLHTDYVDLYYQHVWDRVTPVEEVLSTMDDLVREGKIRYFGFSDAPAWYVARAQTLAEKEGKNRAIALQLEYSLVERNIEREHIPAAQELGMGICPWSPIAGGFLAGKYKREGDSAAGTGRMQVTQKSANPVLQKATDRNWRILDVVVDVAKQLGKTPAQIALNWAATQPGITSPIIGATKLAQFEDNLAAIDFSIPTELRKCLEAASALPLIHPYMFFGNYIQNMVNGGAQINRWAPAEINYEATASETSPAQKPKASAAER